MQLISSVNNKKLITAAGYSPLLFLIWALHLQMVHEGSPVAGIRYWWCVRSHFPSATKCTLFSLRHFECLNVKFKKYEPCSALKFVMSRAGTLYLCTITSGLTAVCKPALYILTEEDYMKLDGDTQLTDCDSVLCFGLSVPSKSSSIKTTRRFSAGQLSKFTLWFTLSPHTHLFKSTEMTRFCSEILLFQMLVLLGL